MKGNSRIWTDVNIAVIIVVVVVIVVVIVVTVVVVVVVVFDIVVIGTDTFFNVVRYNVGTR